MLAAVIWIAVGEKKANVFKIGKVRFWKELGGAWLAGE